MGNHPIPPQRCRHGSGIPRRDHHILRPGKIRRPVITLVYRHPAQTQHHQQGPKHQYQPPPHGVRAEAKSAKQALLFLKKKQQKNFDLLKPLTRTKTNPAEIKSFLLLFFKKEALSSISKPRLRQPP
jgi:hypothetical protein